MQKTDGDTALSIALTDPEIAGQISVSGGDYQAAAESVDVAQSGFLNVTGSIYKVTIDTAKLDPLPYMVHYTVLVDVSKNKKLMVRSMYDVMIAPVRIQVPPYGAWYSNLYPTRTTHVSPGPEYPYEQRFTIYPYSAESNISYLLMDPTNFSQYTAGQPYSAVKLSELALARSSTDSWSYPWLQDVMVNATKSSSPTISEAVGLSVSISYSDLARSFYLVVANSGPEYRAINYSVIVMAG